MTRPKAYHVTHKAPYVQAHDLTDAGFDMLKTLWHNARVMRKHLNEAAFPVRKGPPLVLGKCRIARIAVDSGWSSRPPVHSAYTSCPVNIAASERIVAQVLASKPATPTRATGNQAIAGGMAAITPPESVPHPSPAAVAYRRWELAIGCGVGADAAARQIQREVTRFGDKVEAFWAGNFDPASAGAAS